MQKWGCWWSNNRRKKRLGKMVSAVLGVRHERQSLRLRVNVGRKTRRQTRSRQKRPVAPLDRCSGEPATRAYMCQSVSRSVERECCCSSQDWPQFRRRQDGHYSCRIAALQSLQTLALSFSPFLSFSHAHLVGNLFFSLILFFFQVTVFFSL